MIGKPLPSQITSRRSIEGRPIGNGPMVFGGDMERGEKGDTGAQGEQGLVGPTGPAGADGMNGTNGTDGRDGVDGKDGVDGINGSNADCTGYLPIGDKGASLKTSLGNVKVLAMESPSLLILDVIKVQHTHEIEQTWLDCVDVDTLDIMACNIQGPWQCYAKLKGTTIEVCAVPWGWFNEPQPPVTVTIVAHRKGSERLRFPSATDFEVEKSLEFRDKCLGLLPDENSQCCKQ